VRDEEEEVGRGVSRVACCVRVTGDGGGGSRRSSHLCEGKEQVEEEERRNDRRLFSNLTSTNVSLLLLFLSLGSLPASSTLLAHALTPSRSIAAFPGASFPLPSLLLSSPPSSCGVSQRHFAILSPRGRRRRRGGGWPSLRRLKGN
jgi:hypothetical protein